MRIAAGRTGSLAIVAALAVTAAAVTPIVRRADVAADPGREAHPLLEHLGPAPEFAAEAVDAARLAEAARVAWDFIERQEGSRDSAATALLPATEDYPRVSLWDVASTLAAYHSAHGLGLLDEAGFRSRAGRLLERLASLPLYEGAVLNKAYESSDGRPAGADGSAADRPTGWSAIDLGRLLIWLHLVRIHHPELAPLAERVVERMDLGRVVREGVLVGEGPGSDGRSVSYQEGKLGYEQYAARGLELWEHRAAAALEMLAHADSITVEGVPLLRDRRGGERLTSDPFVLLGIELGWSPLERRVALGLLEAQRRRSLRTGQITIAGEDALDHPPHYFYYYAVQQGGRPFTVGAHGAPDDVDVPRWVSAKGAWAWYALVPTEYTRLAVDAVAPAALPGRGWRSGVYERTGEAAGVPNLNTAAVILEAALYARRNAPLVEVR